MPYTYRQHYPVDHLYGVLAWYGTEGQNNRLGLLFFPVKRGVNSPKPRSAIQRRLPRDTCFGRSSHSRMTCSCTSWGDSTWCIFLIFGSPSYTLAGQMVSQPTLKTPPHASEITGTCLLAETSKGLLGCWTKHLSQ